MRIHASDKRQLSETGERTEGTRRLLDALSTALSDPHAVLDVVLRAENEDEARALIAQRFRFDDEQARFVLDTQFRRATRDNRRAIEAMLRQAHATLDATEIA